MQQNVLEESLSKKTFDRVIKNILNFLEYFNNVTVYIIRRYVEDQRLII